LHNEGVEVLIVGKEKIKLKNVLKELYKRKVMAVLVEGGSTINASFLEEGLVQKVIYIISLKILGGKDSITSVGGKNFKFISDAKILRDVKIDFLGEDVCITGYL